MAQIVHSVVENVEKASAGSSAEALKAVVNGLPYGSLSREAAADIVATIMTHCCGFVGPDDRDNFLLRVARNYSQSDRAPGNGY